MKNILIFGFGAMGSSLASLIKSSNSDVEIDISDPSKEALQYAKSESLIDGFLDLKSKKSYDYTIICSPLKTYDEIFKTIKESASSHRLIIDFGSLNAYPYLVAKKYNIENFISCHPICGTEKSGYQALDKNLYKNSKFVISRNGQAEEIIKNVESFVYLIGSKMDFIDADRHDKIYALVSHLPQFLSFLTARYCDEDTELAFPNCFRLNFSSPAIWDDIFDLNQDNIQISYEKFFDKILDLYEDFDENSHEKLHNALKKYKDSSFFKECDDFTADNLPSDSIAHFLFRLTIALSYYIIIAEEGFEQYGGTGCKDFLSIINYAIKIDSNQLNKLIDKNRSKLIKYFDEISS